MKIVIFFILMVLNFAFAHAEIAVKGSPDFTYKIQSYSQLEKDTRSHLKELDQLFIERELNPVTLPEGFAQTKTSLSTIDRIYTGALGKTIVFIKAGVVPSLSALMDTPVQINDGYLQHFKKPNGLSIAVFIQTENWENASDVFSKIQTKFVASHEMNLNNYQPINLWNLLINSAHAQGPVPCEYDSEMAQDSLSKLITASSDLVNQASPFQHVAGCVMSAMRDAWIGSSGNKTISESLRNPIESGKSYWESTTQLWNVTKNFFNDFEQESRKVYSTFGSLTPLAKTKIACEVIKTIGGEALLPYLSPELMSSAMATNLLLRIKITTKDVMVQKKYRETHNFLASSLSIIEKVENNLEHNLYAIQRGTTESSQMANIQVIDDLKNLPLKAPSAKGKAGLTDNEIQKLYSQVSDHPVVSLSKMSKYEIKSSGKNFCFGRATAAHIKALMSGVDKDSIRKIWVLGELEPGQDFVPWKYHVATIVRNTSGEWYAIDPFLGKVLSVGDWYKEMKNIDSTGNLRILATEAKLSASASPGKFKSGELQKKIYENNFDDLMNSFQEETNALISIRNAEK